VRRIQLLDCKASFSINPTGPNNPSGWQGDRSGERLLDRTNDYAKIGSHGVVQEVHVFDHGESMTACGCFECIVMLIPEANGVMW